METGKGICCQPEQRCECAGPDVWGNKNSKGGDVARPACDHSQVVLFAVAYNYLQTTPESRTLFLDDNNGPVELRDQLDRLAYGGL